MYKKTFELINDELNFIYENTLKNSLELLKIEIKGINVKFVFLNRNNLIVKTMFYQFDWFTSKPKLKYIKDYLKPYTK